MDGIQNDINREDALNKKRPLVIRALRRSNVRRKIAEYLFDISPSSSYTSEIAHNIKTTPTNVIGAIRGMHSRYREDESLTKCIIPCVKIDLERFLDCLFILPILVLPPLDFTVGTTPRYEFIFLTLLNLEISPMSAKKPNARSGVTPLIVISNFISFSKGRPALYISLLSNSF